MVLPFIFFSCACRGADPVEGSGERAVDRKTKARALLGPSRKVFGVDVVCAHRLGSGLHRPGTAARQAAWARGQRARLGEGRVVWGTGLRAHYVCDGCPSLPLLCLEPAL